MLELEPSIHLLGDRTMQFHNYFVQYNVPHGSVDWCVLDGMSVLQFLTSFLHHPTFKLEWTLNPHVVQMLGVLHFIEIYAWPLFAASLYNSIL